MLATLQRQVKCLIFLFLSPAAPHRARPGRGRRTDPLLAATRPCSPTAGRGGSGRAAAAAGARPSGGAEREEEEVRAWRRGTGRSAGAAAGAAQPHLPPADLRGTGPRAGAGLPGVSVPFALDTGSSEWGEGRERQDEGGGRERRDAGAKGIEGATDPQVEEERTGAPGVPPLRRAPTPGGGGAGAGGASCRRKPCPAPTAAWRGATRPPPPGSRGPAPVSVSSLTAAAGSGAFAPQERIPQCARTVTKSTLQLKPGTVVRDPGPERPPALGPLHCCPDPRSWPRRRRTAWQSRRPRLWAVWLGGSQPLQMGAFGVPAPHPKIFL